MIGHSKFSAVGMVSIMPFLNRGYTCGDETVNFSFQSMSSICLCRQLAYPYLPQLFANSNLHNVRLGHSQRLNSYTRYVLVHKDRTWTCCCSIWASHKLFTSNVDHHFRSVTVLGTVASNWQSVLRRWIANSSKRKDQKRAILKQTRLLTGRSQAEGFT